MKNHAGQIKSNNDYNKTTMSITTTTITRNISTDHTMHLTPIKHDNILTKLQHEDQVNVIMNNIKKLAGQNKTTTISKV